MKKTWLIIGAAVVIGAAVAVFAGTRNSGNSNEQTTESAQTSSLEAGDGTEVSGDSSADSDSISGSSDEEDSEKSSKSGSSSSGSSEDADNGSGSGSGSSGSGSGTAGSGSGSSGNSSNNGNSGNSSNNGTSDTSSSVMGFPYADEDNSLSIDALYNYGGNYIEDGSDEEISSVAMLQVTNTSDQAIEYANIHMTADGTELEFDASLIPAGATVLVMEANKTGCSESASCTYNGAEVAYITDYSMCEDQVTVTVNGGALTVTNISGADIGELRIFYKNRMDTGEYVGGIAYNVKIENLAAGASTTVNPSHYDPDYGEVMMVRIYS